MLPASLQKPLCFLILLTGGGCCAAAVGFIVGAAGAGACGAITSAIATLGLSEIIRIGIQNSQPLAGRWA